MTLRSDFTDSNFRMLLVGDSATPEVQSVLESVESGFPAAVCREVRDLKQLAAVLEIEEFPDLIVFVQTWTDEFPFSHITAIPSVGPLAQMRCVYGPWCASDGRSRQDWPFALRIPLEHFSSEIQSIALHNATYEHSTTWSTAFAFLPWTAGRDEVYASRYRAVSRDRNCRISKALKASAIRIDSPDAPLRQVWRDFFTTAGFQVELRFGEFDCDIVLWDADPSGIGLTNFEILSRWKSLAAKSAKSKVIVLTGFHTPDAVARWKSLGAIEVVSKLLPLGDVLSVIETTTATLFN